MRERMSVSESGARKESGCVFQSGLVGSGVGVGERPTVGLVDAGRGARLSVGEALTNLAAVGLTELRDVKCSGNWMWAAKTAGEGALLVDAADAMCAVMAGLGVAVDGGKDSLSMAARVGPDVVKAPGTLVITAYAPVPDIRRLATPDLKPFHQPSALFYLPFASARPQARLGGSALAQVFGQVGDEAPDLDDPAYFARSFGAVQEALKTGLVAALHDVSDGGLLVAALEMAFAGNVSLDFALPDSLAAHGTLPALFQEELGLLCQTSDAHRAQFNQLMEATGVTCVEVGQSFEAIDGPQMVSVRVGEEEILTAKTAELRDMWEETSYQLERLQSNPETAEAEREALLEGRIPEWVFPEEMAESGLPRAPKEGLAVAVVREEGSNGDREMAAAFLAAGAQVFDVTTTDLLGAAGGSLGAFGVLAFVGGFSYGDVLGSAKGWAAGLQLSPSVARELEAFRRRPETLSLGVCNGCQLMARLGWVGAVEGEEAGETGPSQRLALSHNVSGRFESRFTTLLVEESSSVLLAGLAGSRLGVWSAHGEGRFGHRDGDAGLDRLLAAGLGPLRYAGPDGRPSEAYPFNPNGSPQGLAGVVSADGRHLAFMPHPERSFLSWQWPHWPLHRPKPTHSPWLRLFTNAQRWIQKHSN